MELYAVFSSPQAYNVETVNKQGIGTLTQDFVDGLVNGVSCFLLDGRAWGVLHVVHKDRTVVVEPAPRGKKPTWGGFLPQFLGFGLCQKILTVLMCDDLYPYLTPSAADLLAAERNRVRPFIESLTGPAGPRPAVTGGIVEHHESDEVHWHTYAGGKINTTLRYALGALEPSWSIPLDNFALKIRDSDVTEAHVRSVLRSLCSSDVWEDETLWHQVRAALPAYRLSKFQPLMPSWVEQEVLFDYMLDRRHAREWLASAS